MLYVEIAALSPILHLPSPSPSLVHLSIGRHNLIGKGGALKGQPSIVLLGVMKDDKEVPLYPLEVENVFAMAGGEDQSLFGLYSDAATRGLVDNALAKMYGYMLDNGFKYGVLTNGVVFCFLKCGEDGDLMIAEVRKLCQCWGVPGTTELDLRGTHTPVSVLPILGVFARMTAMFWAERTFISCVIFHLIVSTCYLLFASDYGFPNPEMC